MDDTTTRPGSGWLCHGESDKLQPRTLGGVVLYLEDGNLPIDNNHVENRIRPVALGRSNWLFAGSLRAGQRAANIMSLIQSAKLNGHDPYVYLKEVLERVPTQPASRLEDLLPHRWRVQ
jgi:transposase